MNGPNKMTSFFIIKLLSASKHIYHWHNIFVYFSYQKHSHEIVCVIPTSIIRLIGKFYNVSGCVCCLLLHVLLISVFSTVDSNECRCSFRYLDVCLCLYRWSWSYRDCFIFNTDIIHSVELYQQLLYGTPSSIQILMQYQ